MMKLAIVVPCYNEEAMLPISLPRLEAVIDSMVADGLVSTDSYIYCVDDGSRDKTWEIIKRSHDERPGRVKGHTLAHNAGHQRALLSGLMAVKDDSEAAVSIDADLQDDPEAIKAMVGEYLAGNEIVYGVRRSRKSDTWFKRNSARAFYRLQQSMGLDTIYDHADYRLMSSRALDILSLYGEVNLFLRGIVPQIGLNTAVVYYDRAERIAGESKYPLGKMLSFSIDGITSFSSRPMRLIFLTGLLLLLLDIAVGVYVLVSYFSGSTIAGWSSLMLSLWFLGSLILIAIGIVGEYIGKIYFEVKRRPRYAVKERV